MSTSVTQGGRFDIVVFNFERLELFLRNFGKITGFDPQRDRVTVVSASPSPAESRQIADFETRHGFTVRYLTRENRGLEQLARAEYFTGAVGTLEENLSYRYILQMQEHYLESGEDASRWGAELDYAIKSDVVPDDVTINLDEMEELARLHGLKGFFCDRANPCFISLGDRRFVAPCGGNFAIRSDVVRSPSVQRACKELIRKCDDTYRWCVYAEFSWGVIFFKEGEPFFDLKRRRIFTSWDEREFYTPPDNFAELRRYYRLPVWFRALGRWSRGLRRALPSR